MTQFRHGDVMIESVDQLPKTSRKSSHVILAHGEVTGHSHRIEDREAAVLYECPEGLFLEVTAAKAKVVHEEHQTIELEKGLYRVWRQREYSPEEIRTIRD